MKFNHLFVAALSGCLLAVALALGQLTRPEVIIGWVDLFGSWDPRMFVFFLAAALVYNAISRYAIRRQQRGVGPKLHLPTNNRIDARLLIGSAIFGMGWAIGGACPGPALTSLGAGAPWAVVFVAAMAVGLRLGAVSFSKVRMRTSRAAQKQAA
jgi:hypothetical protein